MERFFENAMYASRWILAPVYFGLSLALIALKNKVAASIVAISSIHLLRVFMDAKNVPDNKLMWYVIIHLTFVLSAFVMGYLDKISKK